MEESWKTERLTWKMQVFPTLAVKLSQLLFITVLAFMTNHVKFYIPTFASHLDYHSNLQYNVVAYLGHLYDCTVNSSLENLKFDLMVVSITINESPSDIRIMCIWTSR